MSDISTFGSLPSPTHLTVDHSNRQASRPPGLGGTDNSKIEKSAKDFESILLGSWLQQAEQSFGSLPGATTMTTQMPARSSFKGLPCNRWEVR